MGKSPPRRHLISFVALPRDSYFCDPTRARPLAPPYADNCFPKRYESGKIKLAPCYDTPTSCLASFTPLPATCHAWREMSKLEGGWEGGARLLEGERETDGRALPTGTATGDETDAISEHD